MVGARSRLFLLILFVPACLLGTAALVRMELLRAWTVWQPPIEEPWLANAQPPPAQIVGQTFFGGRLYSPSTVLARTRFAATAAIATLGGVALLLVVVSRFRMLAIRPSPRAPWLCAATRWTLRASPLLSAVYVCELIAIAYFMEVLSSGGVSFVTPAYTLMILFGAAVYLYRTLSAPGDEVVTLRLNGILLDRGQEPDLFAELDAVASAAAGGPAGQAAVMLEPQLTLVQGPLLCGDTRVDGYLTLLPLPLCRHVTMEEWRALAAQQMAPLAWRGGIYADRIEPVYREAARLLRRLAPPDTAFARLSAFLPGIGLCILALEPAEGQRDRVDEAIAETNRVAAARFGSLDLARGLLKTHVCVLLWADFYREMEDELKSFDATPHPHPYEFVAQRFAGFLTAERVAESLAAVPGHLREAIARLGCPELPSLDFEPSQPALALLRGAPELDRKLSAAERARIVFERPGVSA